jgi:Tfp pilus assembly protein PilO
MRRNVVIFLLALVAITALFFVFVYRPQAARISEVSKSADAEKARAQSLRVELSRLKALERQAPQLREEAAKFDQAIPGDPQLAQFILQIQDAANASGIDWISVNPAPPTAGQTPTVQDVNVGMNVTGGYFQVQDFLVRMENLARAVKLLTLNLGGGTGGLPSLTATVSMKTFVSVPAPPPSPSPAPATTGG